MKTVYNGSTFDLMHVGHLYVLRQMRELAGPDGQVVIALNTDEFVEQFKGHRPVQTYLERSEIVAACRYVDRVIPNLGGADSKPAIEAVMPDIIAVGHDWYDGPANTDWEAWGRYCKQMTFDFVWLGERGITLHPLKWLPGHSSTNLRKVAAGPLTTRLAQA